MMGSSTSRRVFAVLVAAWLVSVIFNAEAGGIYWADHRHDGPEWVESLRASNLDGSNPQVMYWGDVMGIAVDPVGRKIYFQFVDEWPPTLRSANVDGSGLYILHTFDHFFIRYLALDRDEGWIYYSATGGEQCPGIFRKRMNGSGPVEPITEQRCVFGIAIDEIARKLYYVEFGNQRAIKRSDLDGSGVETVLEPMEWPWALALDVQRGKIYWSQSGTPEIVMRANMDGTGIETVVVTAGDRHCRGLVLDPLAEKLYWTVNDGEDRGIYRANLDGSEGERLLEVDTQYQIAVDPIPGDVVVPAVSVVGALVLALVLLAVATALIRSRSRRTSGPSAA